MTAGSSWCFNIPSVKPVQEMNTFSNCDEIGLRQSLSTGWKTHTGRGTILRSIPSIHSRTLG